MIPTYYSYTVDLVSFARF